MIIFIAFLAGLLGSLHCIGMCGGIVGLLGNHLPKSDKGFHGKWPYWLGYSGGRLLSYTLAGALAGWLGGEAIHLFSPEKVQRIGLLLAGSFMIALGLYIGNWWHGLVAFEKLGGTLWRKIQPQASQLLRVRSPWQTVLAGLIWGWLPCGLVYSMLVWSMTIATPLGGASIMLAFGLGTLPMVLGMGAVSDQLHQWKQNPKVRHLAGAFIVLFGVFTFIGVVKPFHVPLFSNAIMCETPAQN